MLHALILAFFVAPLLPFCYCPSFRSWRIPLRGLSRSLPVAVVVPDLIEGLIPTGSICTLAGASGVGKTCLYATWIKRWLENQTIVGKKTRKPAEIGILCGDRRWQSHRQWFDAAGIPEDAIKHYSLRDDESFPWTDLRQTPKVKDMFSRALDKLNLAPDSLVIPDPLALWIPGKVNDYKDVAIGLGVIDNVIKPRDLTMLGIFHQAKQIADKSQQYKRPQDKILGSAAQIGFSDTAMYLLGPEDLDVPYYGFGWVPHNAIADTFKFTRDAWGLFVPYTPHEDLDSVEHVHDIVPADTTGATVPQIEHQLESLGVKLTSRTIYRCLKKLMEDGRIQQPSRGKYRRSYSS